MKACVSIPILMVLLIASGVFAADLKDPRLTPIAQAELTNSVLTTPLNSPLHYKLISRAYSSGLAKTTLDLYLALAKKKPDNGQANLLEGLAIEAYWWYATARTINKMPFGSPQEQELMVSMGTSLGKAVILSPKLAEANREYGYYLWQFAGREAEGLSYLRKASTLAPKDAEVHAVLGEMYASPNPGTYSPGNAEAELRKSIRLDPCYAFPYFTLARLYVDQQRYQDAELMLKAYTRLLPSKETQTANIDYLHQRIIAGLGK